MKPQKILFLICLMAASAMYSHAKLSENVIPNLTNNANDNQANDVTLTVSADGATKDEAIKNALRSAIESAYGTFVSANTSILNDSLVKDEIVSIASGNIKNYSEVDSNTMLDGKTFVVLKATVSITNLVSYAKSKGAETEFAGATFAMNLRMKELNKANEEKAIGNMLTQMNALLKNGFDYSIKVGEPVLDGDYGIVTATVDAVANSNCYKAFELFFKTINSLSLNEGESEEYKNLKIPFFTLYYFTDYGFKPIPLSSMQLFRFRSKKSVTQIADFFSSNYQSNVLAFTINNNLGSYKITNNKTTFSRKLEELYRHFPHSGKTIIIGSSGSMTPKGAYELYGINCSVKLNPYNKTNNCGYIDQLEQWSNMPISGEISVQRNYYEDFTPMANNRGLLLSVMLEYEKLKHEITVSLKIHKDDFMKISKFTVQPIN